MYTEPELGYYCTCNARTPASTLCVNGGRMMAELFKSMAPPSSSPVLCEFKQTMIEIETQSKHVTTVVSTVPVYSFMESASTVMTLIGTSNWRANKPQSIAFQPWWNLTGIHSVLLILSVEPPIRRFNQNSACDDKLCHLFKQMDWNWFHVHKLCFVEYHLPYAFHISHLSGYSHRPALDVNWGKLYFEVKYSREP